MYKYYKTNFPQVGSEANRSERWINIWRSLKPHTTCSPKYFCGADHVEGLENKLQRINQKKGNSLT